MTPLAALIGLFLGVTSLALVAYMVGVAKGYASGYDDGRRARE